MLQMPWTTTRLCIDHVDMICGVGLEVRVR
jgi:hypothetical protein